MSHIVRSDSVLARTAAELLSRHRWSPEGDATCPACDRPAPCPAARHADLVLAAAPGLTEPAPLPERRPALLAA
ncbi:hypothetical protein ACFFX1_42080 [Dactylosporangium sucinum]|uniref:Uncharacterized protein n=1 Tax=Dactylosporangium sucinum TaxID=1424081 RepID=A0A917X577_9ACTN|nr:hypothetical protein [Dactylosporangium sucinum]GGM78249.1 hypothetical protein GCM10007977_094710 [Dactylosporangium sucinum]